MDEVCQAKKISSIDTPADYDATTFSSFTPRVVPIVESNANDSDVPTILDPIARFQSPIPTFQTTSMTWKLSEDTDSDCPRFLIGGGLPNRSVDRRNSAISKVPSPLKNELKSDSNARHRAYRKKAMRKFTRYKLKKHRAMPNGSISFSKSDRHITGTQAFDCSGSDFSGNCSASETPDSMAYLETAFHIIQWCAHQVGPQLKACASSQLCDGFPLMAAPVSKDEKEAFSSMSEGKRLLVHARWFPATLSLSSNDQALKFSPSLKDSSLECSLGLETEALEAAILRRFVDQVDSLWEEYVALRAERCEDYLHTDFAFNEDRMHEFMAMVPEDRLAFYRQWCAEKDDLAHDELAMIDTFKPSILLTDVDIKKLVNVARRRDVATTCRPSELRGSDRLFRYGSRHPNRSTFSDYRKPRIIPRPSEIRTLHKAKEDADYLCKEFPVFFPPVSQLDPSLSFSDSDQSEAVQVRAIEQSNPPYTKVLKTLSNLCFITFLEKWTQYEANEETYFETFPWLSLSHKRFAIGCQDSITLYELRYIEDRLREREEERSENPDEMADLRERQDEQIKKFDEMVDLSPSVPVRISRPGRVVLGPSARRGSLLHELRREILYNAGKGLDILGTTRQVSDRLMIPSGYGPPTNPPSVEIAHVSSRSDSVSTVTLGIPPGYGPPKIPRRKPVAHGVDGVEIVETVDNNLITVLDTPPNTPPTKPCGPVIRAGERSTSWISDLVLPAPELSDSTLCSRTLASNTAPAKSDSSLEVKKTHNPVEAVTTTVKPRKVSFAEVKLEVKYRPSVDDPTPIAGSKDDEDSGICVEDLGKALDKIHPTNDKKSLTRRLRSRIKKATSPRKDVKIVFGRTPSWRSSWSIKEKTSTETDHKSVSGTLGRGSGRSLKEKASMLLRL